MGETEITKSEKVPYKTKLKFVTVIANPLASKSSCKKVYKLLKAAMQVEKGYVYLGLKDVQRAIRKGEKGFVVLAGDVTPVDIISHMPVLCEENQIVYCFTPLRKDIGQALGLSRSVITVLVKPHPDYNDLFTTCTQEFAQVPVF